MSDAAAQVGFDAGREARENGDDPAEQVYKAVLAALAIDEAGMRDLKRRVRSFYQAHPSGSPISDAYGHVLWMIRQHEREATGADRAQTHPAPPDRDDWHWV